MEPTRRRVLRAVAAGTGSVALAGCTGNGGGTATDTPTSSPEPTGSSATVEARSHPDHGEVLVGPEGMTLYMFDNDSQGAGESTCYDSCPESWPPLTVEGEPVAGGEVTAELSTFEREDGGRQVAAAGWPLYYYAADEEPGDATGQGAGGVWWVLRPDGTPVRETTPTETDGGVNY